METQLFYRQSGLGTSEYVEKRLGKKSDFAHSKTSHGHDAHSEGEVEQAVPLMTVQDVAELDDEEIIILHRNRKPIRAKRMDFRNSPELARLTAHRLLHCRRFLSQLPFQIFPLTSPPQTNSVPNALWPTFPTACHSAPSGQKRLSCGSSVILSQYVTALAGVDLSDICGTQAHSTEPAALCLAAGGACPDRVGRIAR